MASAQKRKLQLFPSPRLTKKSSKPLSILDATVARFTTTGSIWLFDDAVASVETLVDHLQTAFVATLAAYPHWAGQLQWAPTREGGTHTERFNRPMVVYGTETDPGVEWTVVHHDADLISLVPPTAERVAGAWMASEFSQADFISDTPLALHNLRDCIGLPGMAVQINVFPSGYAIGVRLSHPLADAQSLMVFMHHWAANSRKLFEMPINSIEELQKCTAESPLGAPVFNPAQLDAHAAGDIDATSPDPAVCEIARALPLHRYDWWKSSVPGYPQMLAPTTQASKPENIPEHAISPSTPGPWDTWNLALPVSQVQIHFSDEELKTLREAAQAEPNGRSDISRLDALLAHIWGLVNRARGHSESTGDVYLNVTLGARSRVSPPLPDSFIGSPIFLAYVKAAGSTASKSTGKTASLLRETLVKFTPNEMGAILHDAAHEVSPQRLWQAFLGNRHTLVTSWMRLRVYDVEFEAGKKPRYVQAIMPTMDGCMQVMDSPADVGGVDVSLYLEEQAMKRLVDDPDLVRG